MLLRDELSSDQQHKRIEFRDGFVAALGGFPEAVEAVVAFGRVVWRMAYDIRPVANRKQWRSHYFVFPEESLCAEFSREWRNEGGERVASQLLAGLEILDLARRRQSSGMVGLEFTVVQPVRAARDLLEGLEADHQLQFFAVRAIRRQYRVGLSSRVAQLFHILSAAANRAVEQGGTRRHVVNYNAVFHAGLLNALRDRQRASDRVESEVELFLDTCRAVNYILPAYDAGEINVRAQFFDAEFLICKLFGMSTGIEGFDGLFGGGGLMLVDDAGGENGPHIRGRTVLTMGRYATGKSLLGLQIATEIATKGGVAWVMPLEQSADECLYTVRSMCNLPGRESLVIAMDAVSARKYLEDYQKNRGLLILLRTLKESFELFRATFPENVQLMRKYPMRLIVVDPINAVYREEEPVVAQRNNLLQTLEQAKGSGTNVWLIAEEATDEANESRYEQNIADTVIRLSLEQRFGFTQRYLEITKSRLQREQRGKHPYSIDPGRGITVYPSCAAVSERISSRRVRLPDTAVQFGFQPLDSILGENAIRAGDVIVLQGPAGSLKTPVGLMFTLCAMKEDAETTRTGQRNVRDKRRVKIRNLFIAARDDDTSVEWLMRQRFLAAHVREFNRHGQLRIRSLRSGYVQPGYILQRLEDELLDARVSDLRVERVTIDNVSHWEMACPYLRHDQTFAETVTDLLRRNGVTSLLTCSRFRGHNELSLHRSLVDDADCVIQFESVQFRGSYRVILRVVKTRAMQHRRESFELLLTPDGVDLRPVSSLLRIGPGGLGASVGVRLFLHAETDMQEDYNQDLLHTVKSVLSADAELKSQTRLYMADTFQLASASANDELQLLQLDEFQVPASESRSSLYRFRGSAWDRELWNDYFPRFTRDVCSRQEFSVLPLYQNVSVLAYRRGQIGDDSVRSWTALAEASRQWEEKNGATAGLFFEFPQVTQENYNCLYLEILLSLCAPPTEPSGCCFQEWLRRPEALEAAELFRTLCRRAYLRTPATHPGRRSPQIRIEMSTESVVWRTWYGTLNQMLSKMPAGERLDIEVIPLPNRVSISGEWYLGVPSHSAAPDVALNLIKFLTSREAELDRARLGVGLPTRSTFYQSKDPSIRTKVSPFFSMEIDVLRNLVETAFARSSFDCYAQFAGVLAPHLQTIIEIGDGEDIHEQTRRVFESLEEKVEFLRKGQACGSCARTARRPQ